MRIILRFAVGGGSNSSLWRQIATDVYDMTVVRTGTGQQAAALGAAVVAGVGTGVWKDFGIVDQVSTATDRHAPVAAHAAAYERLFARYQRASALLGEWAR